MKAPREYWKQKLEDIRPAHEFATAMLREAEAEGNNQRIWNWMEERKRLASIFAFCKMTMRTA